MSKTPPKLKIKNTLAEWRTNVGLTQQTLAEEIGVTRATILAIEKGDYNPSLELAFRLVTFFKTDIHSIFQIEEQNEIKTL